jgi:hypothetical protein
MPTVQSQYSGYRYWTVDPSDQSAPRLEFINIGQWQCNRCGAVVNEMPETTFDARATAHVQGHQS